MNKQEIKPTTASPFDHRIKETIDPSKIDSVEVEDYMEFIDEEMMSLLKENKSLKDQLLTLDNENKHLMELFALIQSKIELLKKL